jgi:hypothetical protein
MDMPETTPDLVLTDQVNELRRQFSEKEKMLSQSQLPDEEHNAAVAELQADFDKQFNSMQSTARQFQETQRLADAGLIPADKAQEAMWRMILPKETTSVMFPAGGQRSMPVGELTGKPMTKTLNEFATGAPTQSEVGWHGWTSPLRGKIAKQADLVKQYVGWRQMVGYDTKNAATKTQLDGIWDDKMASSKSYEWDPSHPEIQSLRAKGALTTAYANKNKNTPIMKSVTQASPFAAHVREQVEEKKPAMIDVFKPDGSRVRVPAGEWAKQKMTALQEGWKE